jgi:hypothetical protein
LAGGAAALLWFVVSPLACGGDAFTVGSGGDDGGSSSGTASSSGGSSGGDAQGDDGPAGDDGGPDGTIGEGGHPDGPPPVDAPQEAPPGSVVYVSNTSGNDSNDGTDPTKPKKTIAAALTRAQSITSSPEVHVCKGVYIEKGLSLSQTLKLLGAYDCSTWHRTASYGFPNFDGVNATTIQNADPSAQPATLVVTGAVAPSATVDGFTVQGAASNSTTTAAVETLPSASPVLSNDILQGGGGTGVSGTAGSGKPGSIGVAIAGGSPEVTLCAVSGGSGNGNIGSTGIAIGGNGTPYVHDALVSGGSGVAASASDTATVGILVTTSMAQAQALKNLYVVANDDGVNSAGPTIGIDVAAVSGTPINVDIQGSDIKGGVGTGGNAYSAGVVVADASGTVRILGSHVYGGSRGGGAPTYGAFVEGAGTLNVHNSEIHAGTTTGSAGGVVLVAASNASIVDDTIYTGSGGGGAINVEANVTGVVITDDLLLGSDSASAVGVIVPACQSGQIARFDYLGFVNLGTLYQCGSNQTTTVATMAAALPGVSTTGDFQVGSSAATCLPPTCILDPGCPGAPGTCIPTILGASFSTTDDGVSGLFNGAPATSVDAGGSFKGWWLPSGTTLCAIARGGTPYAGITTDIFGQVRDGSKPTVGAFEYTLGKCQ